MLTDCAQRRGHIVAIPLSCRFQSWRWVTPRQQKEENTAKAKDIGALVDSALCLLGCHVSRRPRCCGQNTVIVPVGIPPRCLGHTPVEHEYLAERAEHDVLRLQIPMHHSRCMCERHRVAHLQKDTQEL